MFGHVKGDVVSTPGDIPSDAERFRGLFEAYYNRVLAYALRRVSTLADAEDVASAVFLVAWRRLDDLSGDETMVSGWLFGTARRVLSNHYRSSQRALHLVNRLDGLSEVIPEVEESDGDDMEVALSALALLNPTDRELILMAVWEEASNVEIARALGMNLPGFYVGRFV